MRERKLKAINHHPVFKPGLTGYLQRKSWEAKVKQSDKFVASIKAKRKQASTNGINCRTLILEKDGQVYSLVVGYKIHQMR